jgi:CheY-like chemotaxis protein
LAAAIIDRLTPVADGEPETRILLVYDNAINREIAITILRRAGLEVVSAVD